MKIIIETVKHEDQRYETAGDWWFEHPYNSTVDILQIRISDVGNPFFEALLAEHELAEALLCLKRNIKEKDVTAFDEKFEKARREYPDIFGDTEPGDHPKAPYHNEHQFASRLEHSVAMELGISWEEYNKTVNEL